MDLASKIALWLCPELKEHEQLKLLQHAKDLKNCIQYAGDLRIHLSERAHVFLNHPEAAVEHVLNWLSCKHHAFISFGDEAYPALLSEIDTPPPFISVLGNPAVLHEPQVGIVGCRNMTHYGAQNAFQFAKALVEIGVGITSGLARGIDALAHEGALAGKGTTIAVLGAGLRSIYPTQHTDLAEKIAQTGAVISEFPLDRTPMHHQFPMRNRLISGLSLGVLVVEAAEKSGSLITARCALKQNREVFAIPGSIHSPSSKGCHSLLKQGATLVESLPDLLLEITQKLKTFIDKPPQKQAILPLEQNKKGLQVQVKRDKALKREGLLTYFEKDALMSIDALAEKTGESLEALATALLNLELQGAIMLTPGGYKCLAL